MALTAGTRLGPYEILSPLGAGGMGDVATEFGVLRAVDLTHAAGADQLKDFVGAELGPDHDTSLDWRE